MPELPEVETVRRGLIPVLQDEVLIDVQTFREDLRYPFPPFFVERLKGQTVKNLERRAKYLLLHLNDDQTVIIHLGMSGRFRIDSVKTFLKQKHDHVIFQTPHHTIAYNDARRFGLMDLTPTQMWPDHIHFNNLGPEPFDQTFDSERFHKSLSNRHQSIKVALLDQQLIAGVGNIYASESLWQSGINPHRSAGSLTLKEAAKLLTNIRDVLNRAIEAGGSTLRDHQQPDGKLGYFQHQFSVYNRHIEPCLHPGCKGDIKKISQTGRSTFYCERCQR